MVLNIQKQNHSKSERKNIGIPSLDFKPPLYSVPHSIELRTFRQVPAWTS